MCELLYFCMYTHTVICRVFKLCAVTLGMFSTIFELLCAEN